MIDSFLVPGDTVFREGGVIMTISCEELLDMSSDVRSRVLVVICAFCSLRVCCQYIDTR